MNALRLLDLDGFANIKIGYVFGLWDCDEFRRRYAEMRMANARLEIPSDLHPLHSDLGGDNRSSDHMGGEGNKSDHGGSVGDSGIRRVSDAQ
jgi:hypothetical protein